MKFRCLLVTIMTVVTVLLPSFAQEETSEQYVVKVVHFLPKDRETREGIVEKIKMRMKHAQQFYADQMEKYGYDRKTFRFEADANGNAVVHHIIGKHDDADYQKNPARCFGQFAKKIQTRNTILVVYIDYSKKLIGKGAAGVTYSGKRILIPATGTGWDSPCP